eukprot:52295-Rhodomonas_salina.1
MQSAELTDREVDEGHACRVARVAWQQLHVCHGPRFVKQIDQLLLVCLWRNPLHHHAEARRSSHWRKRPRSWRKSSPRSGSILHIPVERTGRMLPRWWSITVSRLAVTFSFPWKAVRGTIPTPSQSERLQSEAE